MIYDVDGCDLKVGDHVVETKKITKIVETEDGKVVHLEDGRTFKITDLSAIMISNYEIRS